MDNLRISIDLDRWADVQRFIDALDASITVKATVKTLVVQAYEAGRRAPIGSETT